MKRAIFILILAGCAHKALPPSKDIFSPWLSRATSPDRNTLILVFNEPIDIDFLKKNIKLIAEERSVKPVLIDYYNARRESPIIYLPELKSRVIYIKGLVKDTAGNIAHIKRKVVLSKRIDTIAPIIARMYPSSFSSRIKPSVNLSLVFNEPVDTGSLKELYIAPYTNTVKRIRKSWTELRYLLWDSTAKGMFSVVVLKNIKDIKGNGTKLPYEVHFTSDSVFPQKYAVIYIKDTLNPYYFALTRGDSILYFGVISKGKGISWRFVIDDSVYVWNSNKNGFKGSIKQESTYLKTPLEKLPQTIKPLLLD